MGLAQTNFHEEKSLQVKIQMGIKLGYLLLLHIFVQAMTGCLESIGQIATQVYGQDWVCRLILISINPLTQSDFHQTESYHHISLQASIEKRLQ